MLKENQEALASQLNVPTISEEPPIYTPENAALSSDDNYDDEDLYADDDYDDEEVGEEADDDDDFDYDDID